MKYLCLLLLLSVSCSCSMNPEACVNYDGVESEEFRLFPDYNNLGDLCWLVNNKIMYKSDKSSDDSWKTPEETLRSRQGDCEDIALIFMSFAKKFLNVEGKFTLIESGDSYHAVVFIDDCLYDPTNPVVFELKDVTNTIKIVKQYSYREAMRISYTRDSEIYFYR